jgi:RNA polymerase sigma factor (sigma-70 family)
MAPRPNPATTIDACLISGSEKAWLDFVQIFQPLIASVVVRVIKSYGGFDCALADDLVQEVYVRLCKEDCKALRQFEHRHQDSIFGFVKVVAASVAKDHFRAQRREKRNAEVRVGTENFEATVPAPSIDIHRMLAADEVFACVERITSSSRDLSIFQLYYRQGYSASDIAKIPGINLSAKGVESTILRLVHAIRSEMNVSRNTKRKGDEGLSPLPPVGDIR